MAALTLVIGNMNYSSWSMRPWVLMRQLGIPFEQVKLRFHSQEWDANIQRWSPSRLVPVLWREEQSVWDSLAIMETLHEWYPEKGIWPRDPGARAFARSAAAEMHSGFRELRSSMPMNIRAAHPGKGLNARVQADIDRIVALWTQARERFAGAGPFLFGDFCAADAMYAPVVMRFATYAVPLAPLAADYCDAMRAAPGVSAWVDEARRETEFVAEDEPYATPA
ncbi:MAG TPA: glutathione S-transferase family protein [Usitatibacter sp.]|nr:glutathione S-transferase family protein [Usitatibacter sp.]